MKVAYLDLDGVLVNWDKAAMDLFLKELGLPATHVPQQTYDELPELIAADRDITLRQAMNIEWARIDELGPRFWEELEPYEMGFTLYEELWAVAPVIFVTSPSLSPDSAAGKMLWLQKHRRRLMACRGNTQWKGGRFPVKYVTRAFAICPEKALLAGPDKVLIDDKPKNINRFEAWGGTGVLWPQPWNPGGHGISPEMLHYRQCQAIEETISLLEEE